MSVERSVRRVGYTSSGQPARVPASPMSSSCTIPEEASTESSLPTARTAWPWNCGLLTCSEVMRTVDVMILMHHAHPRTARTLSAGRGWGLGSGRRTHVTSGRGGPQASRVYMVLHTSVT